jgi:hypothetical protein
MISVTHRIRSQNILNVPDENSIDDYLHPCGFHFILIQCDEFLAAFFENLDQKGVARNFISSFWFFRKTPLFFRPCPLRCRANADYVSSNHLMHPMKL